MDDIWLYGSYSIEILNCFNPNDKANYLARLDTCFDHHLQYCYIIIAQTKHFSLMGHKVELLVLCLTNFIITFMILRSIKREIFATFNFEHLTKRAWPQCRLFFLTMKQRPNVAFLKYFSQTKPISTVLNRVRCIQIFKEPCQLLRMRTRNVILTLTLYCDCS